jgi:hypothetical protein
LSGEKSRCFREALGHWAKLSQSDFEPKKISTTTDMPLLAICAIGHDPSCVRVWFGTISTSNFNKVRRLTPQNRSIVFSVDKVSGGQTSLARVVSGQQPSVYLHVKLLALPAECEGDMSGRLRVVVVLLLAGLTLAACGSALPSDAVPLPRPAPKFSAAAPALPNWRHVPEPVSAEQFNQDKATCTNVAHNSPGLGSPEMKFYFAFKDCMQSVGYEASL